MLLFFQFLALTVANVGLTKLISITVPVLTAIYPLAIVLIVLTFLHSFFKGKSEVYLGSLLLTAIISILDGLMASGVKIYAISDFFTDFLPLYSVGIGWVLPAIFGGVLGFTISLMKRSPEEVY